MTYAGTVVNIGKADAGSYPGDESHGESVEDCSLLLIYIMERLYSKLNRNKPTETGNLTIQNVKTKSGWRGWY